MSEEFVPSPEFLASFVGVFEILCGALVLIGLFTRFASIPLIIIMLVAISTTKIEILIDKGFYNLNDAKTTPINRNNTFEGETFRSQLIPLFLIASIFLLNWSAASFTLG